MMSSLMGICASRMSKQLLSHKVPVIKQIVRNLEVHEHVAYTLLKTAGIPTPPFEVAKTPDEAASMAKNLNTKDIVLKAQVLAGGRGVGRFQGTNISGVMMCETPEQAKKLASDMIGKVLVTKQTGAAGKICNSVMVTTRMFPRKEYYLSVMLERTFDGPVLILSKQGGVNIEDIAATNPEAISYIPIDVNKGLTVEQANTVGDKLGLTGQSKEIASIVACNLYELFIQKDALLLEINPFAEDICGEYYALDCKCNFDDSADFRQKELFAFKDTTQMDPREVEAEKYDLSYITLDGNIGCLVNGAGLAMATMDIIQLYGGMPANFLDVGGTATIETVTEGFKILSTGENCTLTKEAAVQLRHDGKRELVQVRTASSAKKNTTNIGDCFPSGSCTNNSIILATVCQVEAILINIFGGIMRCDIIAQGIINASQQLDLKIPVVIRLQGTNVKEAKAMIASSKLKVFSVDDFAEAAETSVKLALMMNLAKSLDLDINISAKSPDKKTVDCNKKKK